MADVSGLARLGPVVVGDLVLAGNPITSLQPLAVSHGHTRTLRIMAASPQNTHGQLFQSPLVWT